jgi:hypothetical protein
MTETEKIFLTWAIFNGDLTLNRRGISLAAQHDKAWRHAGIALRLVIAARPHPGGWFATK